MYLRANKMVAPKGNRFWKLRQRSGRKPKYANADELRARVIEYFEWSENRIVPVERHWVSNGKLVVSILEIPMPVTVKGLRAFLGVSERTWRHWKQHDSDFRDICEIAEDMIIDDTLGYLAAGIFKTKAFWHQRHLWGE